MKDKHTQAFIQEAFELLDILETSLLELEANPTDEELIGKVFRSLHTLKGAGGMFGFDDVAAFVHDIETVYDRIRNGEQLVNHKIIDLTLKACDQLSLMIKKDKDHSLIEEESAKEIISAFKEFLQKENTIEEKKNIPVSEEENSSEKKIYNVFFEPSEDIFLQGSNPLNLLNELAELGKAFIIPDPEKIPGLNEIDPEKLYSSWNIILSTNRGVNSVKDVFIFVEDESKISVNEIDKGELKEDADYYSRLIKEPNRKTPEISGLPIKKVEKKLTKENSKAVASENISSIRVNSDKLDMLVNLVGELVTVQARLSQTAVSKNDPEINAVSENVERLTWELREIALSMRMLPIGSTFKKFNRLVRDLSKELGKEVELVPDGGETELDKNVIEKLNDPLVHIIRNCIDHGIEKPEVRINNGKEKTGKVFLSAMHSGTHVLISIRDDGAGLNKEALLKKAAAQGIIPPDANLTEKEIYSLIFKPGFSTAKEITNVSGRGVGMDVVKTAIESLRGFVEVQSSPGEGTTITLKLPLTLAIIEGLIVRIDKDYFVIPLSFVEECIELKAEEKNTHGRSLTNVRGEIVPYILLRKKFKIYNNQPPIEQIVVINDNKTKTGFVVDEIIGEHQTVIKSLGTYYRNIEMMSGATVLGDGTVALIIDVQKVIGSEIKEERLLVENYN